MRKRLLSVLWLCLFAHIPVFGQGEKLVGQWEGVIQTEQGERPATASFKKAGAGFTGSISGARGSLPLKDIRVDNDKVTARAEADVPQGRLTIDYSLVLKEDALNGSGAMSISGSSYSFDFDIRLKRKAEATAPPAPAGAGRPQRNNVPQPQQKQSIDYFAGKWNYKYLGRDSALGPAPREGVATFIKGPDGKSVEGVIKGKSDAGAYQDTMNIVFEEASKTLSVREKLAAGPTLNSKADWSSPISIRFTIEPVKIKGQTLQLRRIINVVSAHSFTMVEELSEDGGPFVRLGSAIFSKLDEQ